MLSKQIDDDDSKFDVVWLSLMTVVAAFSFTGLHKDEHPYCLGVICDADKRRKQYTVLSFATGESGLFDLDLVEEVQTAFLQKLVNAPNLNGQEVCSGKYNDSKRRIAVESISSGQMILVSKDKLLVDAESLDLFWDFVDEEELRRGARDSFGED